MEHESFEDEEIAALLNRDFVAIKVDREERPDIDHVYMAVCQAITGQGGWPLTIVMTPEKQAFFAGTYFPKQRKFGRFGLMELLPQIAEKWRSEQGKLIEAGAKIADEIGKRMSALPQGDLKESLPDEAYEMYAGTFDSSYGGFGRAPKFPSPHNLSFLLRYAVRNKQSGALAMVEKTLDAMHRGGMYDHVGFGFARYSTDERWLVPHFEKMLYDNALLAIAYVEAFQMTGKARYRRIAEQIFTYVLRDMRDEQGAFYSAEDADSEGEEGRFYVWTPEEVRHVLGEELGGLYCELYDITEQGNFEGENIPNLLHHTLESFAAEQGMSVEQLETRMEEARSKLFAYREQRVHPHKDDKILTSWNGLMIAALAKAAKALQSEPYARAAEAAAEFVRRRLVREDGRLLARFRAGEAAYPGYVDDYAFLVWGWIELYEATFRTDYLEQAIHWNDEMIRLFWDGEDGGLYFYGEDGETLFSRNKEIYDGALPSGNSVAALNLLKLAHYTGDSTLSGYAEKQLRAFAASVERYPAGHSMFLMAAQLAYGGIRQIVIAGAAEDEGAQAMICAARQSFLPDAVLMFHPQGEGEGAAEVGAVLPLIRDKRALGGKATAYICENFSCRAPIVSLEELREKL